MKQYEVSFEVKGIGQVYNEDTQYEYEHGAFSENEYEMMIDNFPVGELKVLDINETEDTYRYEFKGTCIFTIKAVSSEEAVRKAKDKLEYTNFGKLEEISHSLLNCSDLQRYITNDIAKSKTKTIKDFNNNQKEVER